MSDDDRVRLRVPRALSGDLGGQREVLLAVPEQGTLEALLDGLRTTRPMLERRLRDETRALRRFVNVYVDGSDVRHGDGLGTALVGGQVVEVIQSVAGG